MSDAFERSVRSAAREAVRDARQGAGGPPSYHHAWNRGRRRRNLKHAAVALSAATLMLVALTVPGIPGGREVDEAEVAEEIEPVATAAATPPSDASGSASASASVAAGAATPDAQALDTATPSPSATSAQPEATRPASSPSATAPAPGTGTPSAPTPPAATSRAPARSTPSPTVGASTTSPTPTADAAPFVVPPATSEPGTSSAPPVATTPSNPPLDATPPVGPAISATGPGPARPDATLRAPAGDGRIPCSTDRAGQTNATCLLLRPYACATATDVRAGYALVDLDGDGEPETCTAIDVTSCDTNADGFGDTACIIELQPAPGDG